MLLLTTVTPLIIPCAAEHHLLTIQAAFFIGLLVAASAIDVYKRIVPNSICALVVLSGLICFSPAKLFGVLTALPLLIAAMCKEGSIGGGDIKLMAAAGLVLGFDGGIAGLVIGLAALLLFFSVKTVISALWKEKYEKSSKAALPMAPFLSIGFITIYILCNIAGL